MTSTNTRIVAPGRGTTESFTITGHNAGVQAVKEQLLERLKQFNVWPQTSCVDLLFTFQ